MPSPAIHSFVRLLAGLEYWIDENNLPHLLFNGVANKTWFSETIHRDLADTNLFSYGILQWRNSFDFNLHIQGDRKIAEAISIFLNQAATQLPDEAHQKLRRYQQDCQARYSSKPKHQPTVRSHSIEKYVKTLNAGIDASKKGTHEVHCVQKITSKHQKTFVYKINPSQRPISEIEAFNAECYRVLIGTDRHPKVRPIHDETSQLPIGILSTVVAEFTAFGDVYKYIDPEKNHGPYINKELIGHHTDKHKKAIIDPQAIIQHLNQSRITDHWTASYLEEENDLNTNNFGFTSTSSIKIDDDRATWCYSAKYAPEGGLDELDDITYEYQAPLRASFISTRDLETFPRPLQDATIRFVGNARYGLSADIINALVELPETNKRKYFLYLKRALMPDAMYIAFGEAFIRNPTIRARYVNHKCNRTKKLMAALLKSPEFLAYLDKHRKTIPQKLEKDFNLYNQTQKAFHLSLDMVNTNLLQLVSHIEKKTVPKIAPSPQTTKNPSNEIHHYDFIEIKKKTKPAFHKRHPYASWVLISAGLLLATAAVIVICAYTVAPAAIIGGIAAIGIGLGIKSTIAAGICITASGIGAYVGGSLIGYGLKKLASLFFHKKEPEPEVIPAKDHQISAPTSTPLRIEKNKPSKTNSCEAFFNKKPQTHSHPEAIITNPTPGKCR